MREVQRACCSASGKLAIPTAVGQLRLWTAFLFAALLALLPAEAARAQASWTPSRPIQLVVPYPAGGGTDALARLVAQRLSARLGQSIIVDNRAGAGATVGTEYVARAEPDGHTLLMVTAPNAIGVSLYPKLPFNLLNDFVAVAPVAATQFLVVAHPSAGVSSIKELVAAAKSQPGKFNFGSSGNGTVPHLAMELIKSAAGIELVHVPYKGAAPAIADLLAGQVQLMAIDLSLVLPHVRSGKLRAIAVTGARRAPVAPDIPTVAESGIPGYEIASWYGILAPAKVPRAVVTTLNAEVTRIMGEPDVRDRLIAQGTEPEKGTPESYAAFLSAEVEKFSRLVKASGAKID